VEPPRGGPVNMAGARRIVVRARATPGVRFVIQLTEDGAGPTSATGFAGARGADGEQYRSPEQSGTGALREYAVPLGAFEATEGYGNPGGNEVLDAQALAHVEFYVPGSQGPAEIEITTIRFE